MPTLYSLFKELVVSTFDVREPAKLLLEEFWDSVFVHTEKEVFVDAFYEAMQKEAGNNEVGWTKQEVRNVLTLETEQIDYKSLDNNSLANEIQNLLTQKKAAILPSHIKDQHDFEQVVSNVVFRAMKIFEKKLQLKEHSKLRDGLIEKYVRDTGKSQTQIINELSIAMHRVNSLERNMVSLNDKMNEAQLLLQQIDQRLDRIKRIDETKSYSKISSEDLASYRIQLINYKDTIRLMAEHWSEFASPTSVPLQERRDFLTIKRRIDEISQEIEASGDE